MLPNACSFFAVCVWTSTFAAHRRGLAEGDVTVEMDGGPLHISWGGGSAPVLMTGPVAIEFTGRARFEQRQRRAPRHQQVGNFLSTAVDSGQNRALAGGVAGVDERRLGGHEHLHALEDETVVMPGHGPNTTIREARREYAEYLKHPWPSEFAGDVVWLNPPPSA
jgi:hypothetical protein